MSLFCLNPSGGSLWHLEQNPDSYMADRALPAGACQPRSLTTGPSAPHSAFLAMLATFCFFNGPSVFKNQREACLALNLTWLKPEKIFFSVWAQRLFWNLLSDNWATCGGLAANSWRAGAGLWGLFGTKLHFPFPRRKGTIPLRKWTIFLFEVISVSKHMKAI